MKYQVTLARAKEQLLLHRNWIGRWIAGEPEAGQSETLPVAKKREVFAELAIIVLVVTLYCGAFLDLGTRNHIRGNEGEVFQSLDLIFEKAIKEDRKFPLWNPYISTGMPYAADPMMHAFNPFVSLPVLLFGTAAGFKIAIYLHLLMAALGMWCFGRMLRFRTTGRMWMALMYSLSGLPAARFIQGQYLLVFGQAWVPFALAMIFAAYRTHRGKHIALAGIALALLVFSGNVYYSYYFLYVLALFSLLTAWDIRIKPFSVKINLQTVKILAVIVLLYLGITAIHLFPLVEFWPRIIKTVNLTLTDSHSPWQVILDYTSKNTSRSDAIQFLPPEEFYAYIGPWPFLTLCLVPLAWRKNRRLPIAFFTLLLVFSVLWIDIRDMPWKGLYQRVHFLYQFRYPTRMLLFGSIAVIGLSGTGLDYLVQILRASARETGNRLIRLTSKMAAIAVVLFVIVSMGDLYLTNRKLTMTNTYNPTPDNVLGWLKQHDQTDCYVSAPNGWHMSAISRKMRYWDAWYPVGDIRSYEGAINRRLVQAEPTYRILESNAPAPEGAVRVGTVDRNNIYKYPDNLPLAFSVHARVLAVPAEGNLRRSQVTPLEPSTRGPNEIEITATGESNWTLIVLSPLYPGWHLSIDGRSQDLLNVGGYMAAGMRAGAHRYVFTFQPSSFIIGLVITLVFLVLTLYLLVSDLLLQPGRLAREGGIANFASRIAHAQLWIQSTINLLRWMVNAITTGKALLIVSLGLYLFVIAYRLESFPIYFFGDEAVQTLYGERLIQNKFIDANGAGIPIYVEAAGNRWTPLFPMYIHAATLLLFGKSIFLTRITSGLIGLAGAIAAALVLKRILHKRYWWTVILFLAATPAWFLHSRTAFETVMTTGFYSFFLLFYLKYRCESPRFLYPALIFGAMTFYSYSNAQAIMAVAGFLLFIADLRYHWQNRITIVKGLLLALVLAGPLIFFRMKQPGALGDHLRTVDSYVFWKIPLSEKAALFAGKYLYGLSPQYWFLPNEHDLIRHRMVGFGNLATWTLPFFLTGLIIALRNIRAPAYRALLLAAAAIPAGGAILDITITRVLAFVVPAGILTSLGLDWLLEQMGKRIPKMLLVTGTLILLGGSSLHMLRGALEKGPFWSKDYGLYGMQYGARQLFGEAIPEYLRIHPNARLLVTSTWANGPDNFVTYFLKEEDRRRVLMSGIGAFLETKTTIRSEDVFILTHAEYSAAIDNGKFRKAQPEKIIYYPDGSPGFYFVRLAYVDNIDKILAAEKAERRRPAEDEIELNGQRVKVQYSRIDAGQIKDILDGNFSTLMRGKEANPFILDFVFPSPRTMSGLAADFGSMRLKLDAEIYTAGSSEPFLYSLNQPNVTRDPHVEMPFTRGPHAVTRLHLEIRNLDIDEPANIHIREVKFLP